MRRATRCTSAVTAGLVCAALLGAATARAADSSLSVTLTGTKVSVSQKTVTPGVVRLTVANKSPAARKFSIAGKTTGAIGPGKIATLRISFRPGSYAYVSTGRGTPVKGALVVAAAVPRVPTVPQGSVTAGSQPTATGTVTPCLHPVSTSVTVLMTDGNFTFSQTTIPCGTVTFALTNAGNLEHSLSLGGGAKPGLAAGQTGSMVVNLTPGDLAWTCGTFGHDDLGEEGTLVVV